MGRLTHVTAAEKNGSDHNTLGQRNPCPLVESEKCSGIDITNTHASAPGLEVSVHWNAVTSRFRKPPIVARGVAIVVGRIRVRQRAEEGKEARSAHTVQW